MRRMRKLVGLVLATVMVLAMAMNVSAATVTLPADMGDHTFVAYQIFTGTQSEDKILGNVKWGNGIDDEDFLAALKANGTIGNKFTDCSTALDVAEVLGTISDNSAEAKVIAKIALENKVGNGKTLSAGQTELASGYYLIVDTTNVTNADDAKNAALLQVTNDITIGTKTDKPSVEKKVYENDKYNQDGGYGMNYNDVADHDMGDAVPFKLIGTVPDMTYYDSYKYIFHDTMSAGLTLDGESINVYVASDKAGSDKTPIEGWTTHSKGQYFSVSFDNLKSVEGVSAGKFIIVEYTAVLNQNAEVGLDGNPNEVYLEYSNNPDMSGWGDNDTDNDGDVDEDDDNDVNDTPGGDNPGGDNPDGDNPDGDNPGGNNPPDDHETGKTLVDKVIVFTYELDVTKVDGEDRTKTLEGAEFVLYRMNGEAKEYVVVNEESKVLSWTTDEDDASTLKSNADGIFKVIGLDDAEYFLEETKAPDGYNLLEGDVKLEIIATTTNGQDWTNGEATSALTALKLDVTVDDETTTADGDMDKGIVATNVLNNQGATLPETGGMGTTIFYLLGAILVIGSAVVMITRKRMSR